MKYLALEHENYDQLIQVTPYLEAEAARVWQLYSQGLLREAYWDNRQHTAILVLECADEHLAQSALDSLPLVQAGLITFELIPLAPYDGFERLFKV